MSLRPGAAALPWLALAALLGIAGLCYAPSLSGGFLFDDFPNLAALAQVAGRGSEAFWTFVASGHSGPTGRPLALLSFALQAGAWPGDPRAFHLVNLLLHLACGALLALLGWRIARRWWPADAVAAAWVATLAAGAWLLHPLNVSTTAYVVQRMAQLAALFTVLALLAWCHGRERATRGPGAWRGYAIAVVGLGAFGLCGLLSKETGVLILVYALVLEHWVLRDEASPPRWSALRLALVSAPLLGFVVAVAWRFEAMTASKFAVRDFGVWERLLSQPRMLCEYLSLIVAPLPHRLTLFNDHVAVSRGWFDPATTLPAVLAIAALCWAAFRLRRSQPPLAFAIAWFLGGHLLESTALPLELYFEHRNYLPMWGPLLAAVHYARLGIAALPTARVRAGLRVAGGVVLALFALITWTEASAWGDPLARSASWAAEHPDSPRAVGTHLSLLKRAGRIAPAVEGYARAVERFPDHPGFLLDWFQLGCLVPTAPRPDADALAERLGRAAFDYSAIAVLLQMVEAFERDGRCGGIAAGEVALELDALLANPRYAAERDKLLTLRGRLRASQGDARGALVDYAAAQALRPSLDTGVLRVQAAASLGDLTEVRLALDEARALAAREPIRGRLFAARLERWEKQLRAAEAAR